MSDTSVPVPLLKDIKVREEVLEGNYHPAINLVFIDKPEESTPKFLTDSVEFFKRTAVTDGLKELIVKVFMSLLNVRELVVGGRRYTRSSKFFVIPSLFGGGKSHALATLYHVIKVVSTSRTPEEAYEKLAVLDRDVAELVKSRWRELVEVKPKVVVVHGGYSGYAPAPQDGLPIKTLWGYVADRLGEYQRIATYDREVSAPPMEVLERVLSGKGAVVLVDELVVYYTRFGDKVEVVNSFIQMLAELLGQKEVPSVAVVMSLPYSREREVVEVAYSKLFPATEVKRLLDRAKPEVVIVTSPEDLALIIRRRVFDEDPAKLEKLGENLAERIAESVPAVSRGVVERLKRELPKTYPVHPETIETLKVVHHYLAGYLQLTRSPLSIISDAVRAVRYGCFDWMKFEPYLLMPYHIPVFDESVLVRYLASEDRHSVELTRLKRVLRDAVFKEHTPVSEKCSVKVKPLEYLDDESYAGVATAVSVYIWLRTAAGLGLLENRDAYPTKEQILYAIIDLPVASNRQWWDIDSTLLYLKSRVPFLTEYEGRWLFKWTPPLNELVKRYAMDVTDKEVEDKLIDVIQKAEEAKKKVEPQILRTAKLYFNEIKVEGSDPSIIVFTHPVQDEEIVNQIKYTNTIVLVPDTSTKILDDVVANLRALGIEVTDTTTAWEALKLVTKYLVTCQDKVGRKELEREYSKEIEYEKDYITILTKRLADLESNYSRIVRTLLNRVYSTAKVKRRNTLLSVPIKKGIAREEGIIKAVEDALIENTLLVKSFDESWIKNVATSYLGIDVESPNGISLLRVWDYLLTSTSADVPVLDVNIFVENALLPVKSLEYAVKIGDAVYWKEVYRSRDAAVEAFRKHQRDSLSDEAFSDLVKTVAKNIKEGIDATLVHYRHVVDDWIKRTAESSKLEVVVLTNGVSDYLLDNVVSDPGYRELVKKLACYREKQTVRAEVRAPETVDYGSTFEVEISLQSDIIKKAEVKVAVVGAQAVGDLVKIVEIPYSEAVKLVHDSSSRQVTVYVDVVDEKGNVVGRYEKQIKVRIPLEKGFEEREVTVDGARELLEARRLVAVKSIEVESTTEFYRLLKLFEEVGGGITVTARLDKVRVLTDKDLTVDEAESIVRLIGELRSKMRVDSLKISVKVPSDKEGDVAAVLSRVPEDAKGVKIVAVVKVG
ncbi:MAG: DUF499 domain-containing protein [Thermofilaceae archaeon]